MSSKNSSTTNNNNVLLKQFISALKENKQSSSPTKQKSQIGISRVLIAIVVGLVLYLISKIFTPLIDYKPYIDWWKSNGGSKYKHCINIVSLAYFVNFALYYKIWALVNSELRDITRAQAIFITSLIRGQAVGLVPKGVLTPRMVCESIVPLGTMSTGAQWPSTTDEWVSLFKNWGDMKKSGNYYKVDTNKWQSNPDNFLWTDFAIPGSSDIVQAFITDEGIGPNNQRWYPKAMDPLLGVTAGSATGGWWGFLQQFGGGDQTYNNLTSLVWAVEPTFMSKGRTKKNCGMSALMGGVMGGAGIGIGLAMATEMNPVAGILGLIGGTIMSMGSKGCL